MSGGRAVLGIGAAWFETEHTAYGLDFGSGFGERCDRLDEAVEIMHGMLRQGVGNGHGVHYHAQGVRNDPPPVQEHLPILIGGGGEKKTLRTTARFADAWNIGGDLDRVRRKDEVLRRWCQEFGRDEAEIERTVSMGATVVRDDAGEAERVGAAMGRHNRGWEGADRSTTPEALADEIVPYVELGFRHIYFDFPAPFDDETLERLISDVKPRLLERLAVGAGAAGVAG
jgi:alkanesulfonate monooxygenase SsuD/methylene tetrahydromethanopterin reductase-like flavin-dependent oxidoreductase (luciferase family)